MTEGTYEYECMRAELLGMQKPDEQEWLEKEKERLKHVTEEIDENTLQELENQNDEMKNVSGGLDELNSILSITQKKLNRFKHVCGSLTNLLKIKVNQDDSSESISKMESDNEQNDTDENSDAKQVLTNIEKPEVEHIQNTAIKKDIPKMLDNQIDKLDSMLTKAENAQLSMAHQQKQMKKFLN